MGKRSLAELGKGHLGVPAFALRQPRPYRSQLGFAVAFLFELSKNIPLIQCYFDQNVVSASNRESRTRNQPKRGKGSKLV